MLFSAAALVLACSLVLSQDSDPVEVDLGLSGQQVQLPEGPFDHHYRISAELLPGTGEGIVAGSETVTVLHRGNQALEELIFHLYANAFAHADTVFMSESRRAFGSDRVEERGPGELGYCHVKRLTMGGREIPSQVEGTLLRVPLEPPLAAGATAEIELEFETRLPRTIARMGHFGQHYDVMQWYPKLAMYDGESWRHEEFHAATEFFANFASYDVTLITPDGFEVGATGAPAGEPKEIPGPAGEPPRWQRRYVARAVHDFAWCADPAFARCERTFRYPEGHEVAITYLCQPYALPKAEWVLDTVELCLELYGEWFMPYPYPVLTVDGLPYGLGGGMEYPMLFTISQAFPNHLDLLVDGTEEPSSVTIHEFGHQYWYGIVATDEFREAWLDEGVNTYVQSKIQERLFADRPTGRPLQGLEWREALHPFLNRGVGLDLRGRHLGLRTLVGFESSPFTRERRGPTSGDATLLGFEVPLGRQPGFQCDFFLRRRESYRGAASASPIRALSYEMHPASYSPIVYSKTALALRTLENVFGWDPMREALREYVHRYRFQHPSGDDFLATLSEVIPEAVQRARAQRGQPERSVNLHYYLRQLLETRGVLDYAVATVYTEPVRTAHGYHPLPEVGAALPGFSTGEEVEGRFASTVWIENRGQLELPVGVQLRFEDGSTEWHHWNGRGGWHCIETVGPSPLAEAVVDPHRKLVVDLDFNNNGRRVQRSEGSVRVARSATLFWVQNALLGLRFLLGP